MSKLQWDQATSRLYEVGLDRGVLYLEDGSGVAWNGLSSVEEDFGHDGSEPMYLDGVKYVDIYYVGDFSATLKAFTYPDEFLEYEGIAELGNGLSVDGQRFKQFGLSYRTFVGDGNNAELGYKIHILFNLTAVPDTVTYETNTNVPSPIEFGWQLASVPEGVTGYRPTAHIVFDSRFINRDMLDGIEALLYGDEDDQPYLPTIDGFINFVTYWDPLFINHDPTTGLSLLTSGVGDLTLTTVDGFYTRLPSTRLREIGTSGFYELVV